MGQKLATYDVQGNITGLYDTVDSPAPLGVSAIEITDDQWHVCLSTPGYTVQSGKLVAPTLPTAAQQLANSQTALCASIDSTADTIYIAIGGPSPGRLAEYQQANTDAQAFKASGYTGNVPATVQCWATASNITAQASADNIIATASGWELALTTIRSARLLGKAAVMAATTLAAAQAAAQSAISQIQSVGAATS